MSKISSSNDNMARRNIFLTFAAKEDEERLCHSLLSTSEGSNPLSLDKIAEVLSIGGILSTMDIDPSSLDDKVDVRCHSIVKSISFAPLPDAMILAIAQVAGTFNITSIIEIGEVRVS